LKEEGKYMSKSETGFITEKQAAKAWERREVAIEHSGTKITLPKDPVQMPLRTAIKALERLAKDEETIRAVHEVIDAYPEDALVALNEAMRRKYGWASPIPTPGFFGPTPPQILTIKTGPKPKDTVQVPFGRFTLPGVENPIQTHRYPNGDEGMVLIVTGEVRKREEKVVKELVELAREILKDQSIYKGKAIRLRSDGEGSLDHNRAPEFIDTDPIKPDELILSQREFDQVTAALWTPIRFTAKCIEHGIPLNRGVLLEGIYGTGKTMTAAVTSKICVEHGWTYVLLDDVRTLKEALLFAQRYAPAVVFAEDVDRCIDKRDNAGNDLLNVIDGILTKNSQVITVLTTNFVEKLDKAMLRPGRLDAVISIAAPDAGATEKLLRLYGRNMIAPGEKLDEVSKELAGNIPATIREVVERSKLAMIAHDHEQVEQKDLLIAGRGMANHLALLADKPNEQTLEEQVGTKFGALVLRAAKDAVAGDDEESPVKDIQEKVEEIHNSVC
jgi:hypothetical protein